MVEGNPIEMKNYSINDNNCKLFGVRSGIANAAKRGGGSETHDLRIKETKVIHKAERNINLDMDIYEYEIFKNYIWRFSD